jgi:regulatory protein
MMDEYVENDLSEDFSEQHRTRRSSKKKSPRAYAMDHLSRREMGFHELIGKMVKANYSKQEALEAVLKLQSENLQSDERFVQSFVSSRVSRGQGPNKIRYDLQSKQVKESLVYQVLSIYEQEWFSIALKSMQKNDYPSEMYDLTRKQKAFQYLLRKGHEIDIIYEVLKAVSEKTKQVESV